MSTYRDLLVQNVEEKRQAVGEAYQDYLNAIEHVRKVPASLLDIPLPEGSTIYVSGWTDYVTMPEGSRLGPAVPVLLAQVEEWRGQKVTSLPWNYNQHNQSKYLGIPFDGGYLNLAKPAEPCRMVKVRVPERIEERAVCGPTPVDWEIVE